MTESYSIEERERMDVFAAQMRRAGHNGEADYYSGGWRCYNRCSECEDEARAHAYAERNHP